MKVYLFKIVNHSDFSRVVAREPFLVEEVGWRVFNDALFGYQSTDSEYADSYEITIDILDVNMETAQ